MHILWRDQFEKAKEYIMQYGDDVTRAWFRYCFENAGAEEMLHVLQRHQHENGGFGGLMYEFDYQGPCLKCTEHAFRLILSMKERPSSSHPMIRKMVQYVLQRYRPEIGRWGELLEPGVNDGLHVNWWTYPTAVLPPMQDDDERIRQYNPNGEAALAALVACWNELVPQELYQEIIRYPVEHIMRYYDQNSPLFGCSARLDHGKNDIECPYNLKCYQQFVACLPDGQLADKLAAILRQNPQACMQLDYSAWENTYVELPCDVVQSPQSVVYPMVEKLVQDSLDYLIKRQSVDGAWHLTWSFGKDKRFRQMERRYEAHYTMLVLHRLAAFGRLEGMH